ncbi:MAG TPA: GAF domain-containing sensor histidine kinase [Archangium sp.]|uniref:sensor histidine kinase n=1 Tax=Archangium sp. TaxID=1872627 RepID=UPI002E35D0E5|nr:GAF domain-containing sensor histidine kinase [Archangium sp.]HEX5754258.1 GAF domain-containing sensor histidine kinase [Archangium sp.]
MSEHIDGTFSSRLGPALYERASYLLPGEPEDLFAGGGEMGAHMRAFDWAATSLGPVEGWSQSLRSAVSICLNSRFPILIYAGPELLVLYNDAFIPFFGRKHPELALGRPGREAWPEVWHVIGPMLEGVLATGRATWADDLMLAINRNGYLEETYRTFSYSPIGIEAGRVEGVFTAVNFTTERVIGERRLHTLRQLAGHVSESRTPEEACRQAARTLAANPADVPFALLYQWDEPRAQATLVASTGLETEVDASRWPLAHVAATGRVEVLTDVRARFGDLPGGPWDESPHTAVLLPISRPGQKVPYGVLVAGVSPRQALDDSYRSFFEMAAGHVASAVANARAYEAERRYAAELRRRVEFEQQLIGIVSHDLRNPINAITLAAHALLRREELDARATKSASRILASAERAARMIRDLLDFTQARLGGGISLERRPTDLRHLVDQVLDELGVAWPERHLEVRQRGCTTGEWDADRMAQVASNLVTNALKYSPADTPVRVELRGESDGVELRVHNDGPPIPADLLPRLFEPLQRGTPQVDRASRSIGLGLYIVKHLVEAHGGTVAAQSGLGRGTTFTVRLPRSPGALTHH